MKAQTSEPRPRRRDRHASEDGQGYPSGEEERERLLAKLNRPAANLLHPLENTGSLV